MGVREDHVRDIARFQSMSLKPAGDQPPHAEVTGIDQDHPALPAHQRDRAPAKPAMAHGLAGKALHQDVD